MKLRELEQFNPITIQCHDNPDADALASGFGLYTFFSEKGKQVRLVYSGFNKIQKTNLVVMIEKLQIPIEYIEKEQKLQGLLITVDCQYGAGNVTKLYADSVAIIDHHECEIGDNELCMIRPELGSCATLVWRMMQEEGFDFSKRERLGTALYYGLFSDTDQFSEVSHPLDRAMQDSLVKDKELFNMFRNSNLSLKEMRIVGRALTERFYEEKYRYVLVKTDTCDPNILGLISDFIIQADKVDSCVVFNEQENGIKFSVRSCVGRIKANELAAFLAQEIGSGGGHKDEAGGFLPAEHWEEELSTEKEEAFFRSRLNAYFETEL